jgi:O-antigen ligase
MSLTAYVYIYFVVVNYVTIRMVKGLCEAIIWIACITSAYGICQHYGLDPIAWIRSSDDRVFSTFGHPAFFSAFLAMALSLVLYRAFSGCKWYLLLLPLILIVFYYTKTRASFLGLGVSMLFFCWTARKTFLTNKKIFAICAIVFVLIFVFNSGPVIGRFRGDVGKNGELTGTAGARLVFAEVAIDIIKDYPLLGVGPDALGFIYMKHLKKVHPEQLYGCSQYNQSRIHNDFLDMAVTRGLPGLAIYVWLIVSFIRMVWRRCDKFLIGALCAGLLSYIVQNQFSFGHISFIVIFWYYIGMVVVLCREKQYNPKKSLEIDKLKFLGCDYGKEER